MTYTPTFADLLERDKTIAHLQDQIDQVRNNLTDLRAQVRQKQAQAQNKLDHTPTSRFTPQHGHTPDKTPEPTNTLSYKVSDLDENITNLKLDVEALSRLASEKHWGFGVKTVRMRCPSCGTAFEYEVKKQEDTDTDEECYDWVIDDRNRDTGFGKEEERSRRWRERGREQHLKKEAKRQKLKERLDENEELLQKEEAEEEEKELPEQKKKREEKLLKEERSKKYTAVDTPPRTPGGKASLSFQLG